MAEDRARQLLAQLDKELADTNELPLPAQDVQVAWLKALQAHLVTIMLLLGELMGPSGAEGGGKASPGVDGGGEASPRGDGGGGLGGVTPLP